MAVTIKDVAKAAGVSAATVTRTLANPDLVRPATRERVMRAVTALGYQPNRAARGLVTGRTGNLGLIVPDLANPFFPGVVKGMQARARESDHAVFLADTDEDAAAEAELVRALSKQVDGVVVCSPRMRDEDVLAVAGQTSLVLLARGVAGIPSVSVDNVDGMRQAVAHLTALGHRKVAYVAGPRDSWSNRERLRGLRAAAADGAIELVEVGNFMPRFEGGVAAADLVLAAGVTSVIAYNDVVALGLINRFSVRQITVPGDLSVIGCDDIALSAMCNPALTTVSLPKEQLGRAGVDLLLQVMEDSRHAGKTRWDLPTHLMVRASTGPASVPSSPLSRR